MTRKEIIKWLKNLKEDIGHTRLAALWHYEQALDETIEALKQEPVKHGKWVESEISNELYNCSNCGGACWSYDYERTIVKSNFCPNCGADMRGEKMSDITNRWDGNYYLTNDQYEDTKRYLKNALENTTLQLSPKTSTSELICDPHSTTSTINSHITACGPTCLSDIVEHKGLGFRNIKIKRIIFNPPATIIIWGDNTKTVVKCAEDDEFNPEIGVAMCYMKKIYGSRHAFSKKVESYIEE